MDAKLRKDLSNVCNLYQQDRLYNEQIKKAKEEINSCNQEYERLCSEQSTMGKGFICLSIFPALGIALFLMLICAVTQMVFFAMLSILVAIFVPVIMLSNFSRIVENRNEEADEKASNYRRDILTPTKNNNQKLIKQLETDIKQLWSENSHLQNFLPQRYQNLIAATFLLQVVEDGRADNLKEALNLYEDQVHKWEMLEHARRVEAQNEYLASQNEILAAQQTNMATSLQNIAALELIDTFF